MKERECFAQLRCCAPTGSINQWPTIRGATRQSIFGTVLHTQRIPDRMRFTFQRATTQYEAAIEADGLPPLDVAALKKRMVEPEDEVKAYEDAGAVVRAKSGSTIELHP